MNKSKPYNYIKDEDIKADVLKIIQEHNDTSLKCYEQYGKYSSGAINNHYGNWTNLLQELGIEPKIHMFTTPEEVLEDIKKVFEETGNTSRANYEKYGKYSRSIFTKHFGRSWNKILSMLGYKISMLKPGQYTKEDILQNYQDLCQKHGKLLNAQEFRKYGDFSQPIIDKIFGGFCKMQQELGVPYFIKCYKDEEIKSMLMEAYNQYGPLNTVIIDNQTKLNQVTLINKYGSVKQACHLFNIPYDEDNDPRNSGIFRIVKQIAEKVFGSHYTTEQRFNWLVYIRPLSIDLFYPDLNLAIEVDGDQHYIPVKYFGGEENLENTKKRDRHKEKLLKEHNIDLIRINTKNIKNAEKIFQDYLALTKDQNASMTY